MNARSAIGDEAPQGSSGLLNRTPAEFAISRETSDDALRAALAQANIPALLMSLMHLTGDRSGLDGPIRPNPAGLGDEQGGISAADQEAVRLQAFDVLSRWRDRGSVCPPPLTRTTIAAMMEYLAGQRISDDYIALMLEEMGLDGIDHRAFEIDPRFAPRAKQFKVAIVGAGFSGILMAMRLKEAGIPWVLYEKNSEVGGTWLENRYPGCRVDTPSHFYSYSFAQNPGWEHHFARQDEVLDYLKRVAADRNLLDQIQFETEVTAARYEEKSSFWNVTTVRGGKQSSDRFNAVVLAVGQLNRPRYPDISGKEQFQGSSFHSARWDPSFDSKGKRIAVIGTGASAFQIVPELAKVAASIDVYQRSAPWIFPTANYHDAVGDGQRWLLEHVPFYGSWYRFWIFWSVADAYLPTVTVDPDWPHLDRSANALNDSVRQILTEQIKLQLNGSPELIERCVPNYPPLSKRLLRDNGSWFAALRLPQVSLINEPIDRIVTTGIVASGETLREYDAIVYATGFRASEFFSPIAIEGKGGADLCKWWNGQPRSFLGVAIPGFPNLFSLYGPNTNIAHGASIVFMTECGVRYVQESFRLLIEGGFASMDLKRDVFDEYNEIIDAANRNRTWGMAQARSWYKNAAGRVTQVWPLQFSEYWRRTLTPRPDHYTLEKLV